MKKIVFLIILMVIGYSCSNSDDNETVIIVDFLDDDGDGVSNSMEQSDGTDPNDGCSFTLSVQEYNKTSIVWRNQDCDGDGVNNGNELDPDANNVNDGNGTNPLDECSFDISFQTATPSTQWLSLDCDGDCRSNEVELIDGTDPANGDDFLGAGDELLQIIRYQPSGSISATYFFDVNTNRFLGSTDSQGNPEITYNYDSNSRLIAIESHDTDSPYLVEFQYTNDLITSYGYQFGDPISVTYENNNIITHAIDAPPGLFTQKFEIDPMSDKVINRAAYYLLGGGTNDYVYWTTTYTYDSAMENLLEIRSEPQGYDPDTQTYYVLPNGTPTIETFEYTDSNALNPAFMAYQSIYAQGLLDNFSLNSYLLPQSNAIYSRKFLTYCSYEYGTYFRAYTWDPQCVQNNQYPTKATQTYNSDQLVEFIYE